MLMTATVCEWSSSDRRKAAGRTASAKSTDTERRGDVTARGRRSRCADAVGGCIIVGYDLVVIGNVGTEGGGLMPGDEAGVFSIAEKLDRLFQQIRSPGQAEFSYMAVAEGIRADQGVSISHTYIWQLRTGRRVNPTVAHLAALALFFGVPVAYFLDDAEARKINGQLELLGTLRDAQVTEIALRAADVSESSREMISEIVRKVWELENPTDRRHQAKD
jgi:transcriptional regulator with XRE-family HTH domain